MQGFSSTAIARALGRHRSSITREFARNRTHHDGYYRPQLADWSARDPAYLSASALIDLTEIAELGGHGATHRALSSLSEDELDEELAASRDYIAAIVGAPVRTMALPGGHGGARERAAALRAGFALVGNSRPLPHATPGVGVNRICVNRTHDARAPLRWAQAGALHWAARRGRYAATVLGRRVMGKTLYGALTALAK